MKARHQRLTAILLTLLGVGIGIGFILKAMNANLLYYSTPTQLLTETDTEQQKKKHHLGGMVKEGSVLRKKDSLEVSFIVTDNINEVPVTFEGILPDLFREGQGIVSIGYLKEGTFGATKVLAKHDENYMPPDIKSMHDSKDNSGKKY